MDVVQRLLIEGLEFLYGAHHQGAEQTEANVASSTYPKLKMALEAGAKLNTRQIKRLDKVFKLLGVAPTKRHDLGMEGLIRSNVQRNAGTVNPTERDLVNINMGQAAAHFYLAKYGAVRHYARDLGHKKVVKLLQTTLDEFGTVNTKLTGFAHQVLKARDLEQGKRSGAGGTLLRAALSVGGAVLLVRGVNDLRDAK